MKKFVWVSYDLGVKGDYEGMYTWLDTLKAKECGDSLALIIYESAGNIPEEIKGQIQNAVDVSPHARIYIIYRSADGKVKGNWLFGGRKAAPWAGYAPSPPGEEDDL